MLLHGSLGQVKPQRDIPQSLQGLPILEVKAGTIIKVRRMTMAAGPTAGVTGRTKDGVGGDLHLPPRNLPIVQLRNI